MIGERDGQRAGFGVAALMAMGVALGGCSSSSLNSVLGSSGTPGGTAAGATSAPAGAIAGVTSGEVAAAESEVPCPEVQVRTGAATLLIGSKPGAGEPAPLDVRYQGSIVTTARECNLNAGLLTIKVGVEGRVITGPAGGPGTVNVPLRIAVVQEGITPKTVVTKLAVIPVTVNNTIDQVSFTHIDPDVAFPMPSPAGVIAAYKIYVGFDPQAAQPQRPARRSRAAPQR